MGPDLAGEPSGGGWGRARFVERLDGCGGWDGASRELDGWRLCLLSSSGDDAVVWRPWRREDAASDGEMLKEKPPAEHGART